MLELCEESWPTGVLVLQQDIPCEHERKHRGWHKNSEHDLQWTGKLLKDERLLRDRLRRKK